MTPQQIQNYERLLGKKYSQFTESEIRQCENYERERTVKPTGEKRLKRERSKSYNKETSYKMV